MNSFSAFRRNYATSCCCGVAVAYVITSHKAPDFLMPEVRKREEVLLPELGVEQHCLLTILLVRNPGLRHSGLRTAFLDMTSTSLRSTCEAEIANKTPPVRVYHARGYLELVTIRFCQHIRSDFGERVHRSTF